MRGNVETVLYTVFQEVNHTQSEHTHSEKTT